MGLESASYISQLVATNPVGGVDDYATADDHLRLIKAVLQGQFPNFTAAAMNATVVELNKLVGVTALPADFNILAGAAAAGLSASELLWVNGVTSAIQTQLNGKAPTAHSHDTAEINDNAITLAKLLDIATASFLGRLTGGNGDPEVLSAANARSIINVEDGSTADQTAGQIEAIVSHDLLLAFVGNKHINHASVSLSAGVGISSTGLGDLTANRTINAENAAEATKGVAEIANQAEVDAGTDDTRIVTPLKLAAAVTPIVKTVDEVVNNSTTYQDDNTLAKAVAINTRYAIEMFVVLDTSVNADFKFRFTGPSGFEFPFHWQVSGPGQTAPVQFNHSVANGPGGLHFIAGASASAHMALLITGTVKVGGTAGTVTFQWAQNALEVSDTTVHENSWLRVTKL
ncbi:hypothetical protein LCGC14_0491470 [marine sediment metagenome]|uniref:Uncharacterized protein n=1 Tax=marine sediment metagenome TaxID=412755 RepID=A0A0F9SBN1_9ZZZZ